MKTLLRFDVFSFSYLFPCILFLFTTQLPLSFGLTLSKLMDDPTSLVANSNWLRVGSVVPHSRPLWFSLPGMVPLASDPPNFSSKVPANGNRYSTNQQSSSSWQLASPDQNQKSVKSATLADVNFPKSGSNRDAPLISTKVLSKRNPVAQQQQHSPSSSSVGDGNRYMADNFDPFSRVDLEDFFNDSPPEAAVGALPPVNSASVINTADGRRRVGISSIRTTADEPMIDGFRDILKIDQLENMFDMDLQF